MAHITGHTHWYLAEIVEEIVLEDELQNIVHITMILIQAISAELAYQHAIALGRSRETSYKNIDGQTVTQTFCGLRNLHAISENLMHGAELFYEERVGVTNEQIDQMIPPRNKLRIFLSITPDNHLKYVPADLAMELETYFGNGWVEYFGNEVV